MEYRDSYLEFIQELEESIDGGFLNKDDLLQVLRGTPTEDSYSPILEWYFNKETMEDMEEDEEIYADYNSVKDELVEITLEEILNELKSKVK